MTDIFRGQPEPTQPRPLIPTKTPAAPPPLGSWLPAAMLQRSMVDWVMAATVEPPAPQQPSAWIALKIERESAGFLSAAQASNRVNVPPQIPPPPEPLQIPPLVTLRQERDSAHLIAAMQSALAAAVPPPVPFIPEPTQGSRPWNQKVQRESAGFLAAVQGPRLAYIPPQVPPEPEPKQIPPLITLKIERESAGFLAAAQAMTLASVPPQRLPDPEPTQIPPLVTLRREDSEPWLAASTVLRAGVLQPPPDPEPRQPIVLVTLKKEVESAGFLAATQATTRAAVPPQVAPDPEPTQGSRPWNQRIERDSAGWITAVANARIIQWSPDLAPLQPSVFVSGKTAAVAATFDSVAFWAALQRPQMTVMALTPDPEPIPQGRRIYVSTGRASSPVFPFLRPPAYPVEDGSLVLRAPFVATAAKGSDWLAVLRRIPVPILEVESLPQGSLRVIATFRAESAAFLAVPRRILLPQEEPGLIVRPPALILGARRDAIGWLVASLRRPVPFQPEEFAHLQRLLRWFPGGANADRIFDLIGFVFGLRRYQGVAQASARFSGTARIHRES